VATDFGRLVAARLEGAGLPLAPDIVAALAGYLSVLALWNRRINLTAFALEPPTDDAIDRLIVEPLAAAHLIPTDAPLVIDIGSGGGSPALPVKIARPSCRMVLVESRERKSAFLREAVRQLHLTDVVVETARLGADGLAAWNGAADVVTMRAVRADEELWRGIARLLRPAGGQLLWLRGIAQVGAERAPSGWVFETRELVGESVVAVGRRDQ
jgi:16S rRNA (guanine527-N7)-methyltransferase